MSVTRRTVLAAPATLAGTAALAQAPQPVPAPGTTGQQAPGFYRYRVGEIEVTAVNDGLARRPLDGFVRNAELDAVKAALHERFLPTDALPIPFTTLVLNTGGKLVLIDTGNGDMGPPTTGSWMRNFRAAGFDPERVDAVVISHFHGDHINGLRLKDGTAVFPRAEVRVPAAEWDFWMDEARMGQAPEAMRAGFQNVRRVFGPIARDVARFQPDQEVAPGVSAVAAHGHTPGHTAFFIGSGAARLLMLVDTANHPALFVRHPDWSAVFDQDADAARATRRRLLDMAAAERAQVAFYHAPFPATGFIARDGSGFDFVPVQWSPTL